MLFFVSLVFMNDIYKSVSCNIAGLCFALGHISVVVSDVPVPLVVQRVNTIEYELKNPPWFEFNLESLAQVPDNELTDFLPKFKYYALSLLDEKARLVDSQEYQTSLKEYSATEKNKKSLATALFAGAVLSLGGTIYYRRKNTLPF